MEFAGEIIATQSPSEGFETPVTVTVTNWSSDKREFELILIFSTGFKTEQSFKILLFINLNSETAVKFLCADLVCVTIRSKDEEGKVVAEIEELMKKKSKMVTCLRTKFEDSMKEEDEGKERLKLGS